MTRHAIEQPEEHKLTVRVRCTWTEPAEVEAGRHVLEATYRAVVSKGPWPMCKGLGIAIDDTADGRGTHMCDDSFTGDCSSRFRQSGRRQTQGRCS